MNHQKSDRMDRIGLQDNYFIYLFILPALGDLTPCPLEKEAPTPISENKKEQMDGFGKDASAISHVRHVRILYCQ